MTMPPIAEPTAAPTSERLSEQPIKFDQAALLRQDPPSRGRIAWLASILVLAVILLLGVMFRNAISAAWPPSLRLYQAVGLMPQPAVKPIAKPSAKPVSKPAAQPGPNAATAPSASSAAAKPAPNAP
ncbi:MAG TPA: hypothetical protein PKX13_13500 [Acidiphilium sp.]|nr:hypothetical protein [Acidiphilium sp.]